ncbi:MAG: methylmalonyl Co-A mutase-associated GTPase MeaB [Saprospiraceae bacterium]
MNPRLRKRRRKATRLPQVEEIVEGIKKGDRVILSQAITLIESTRSDHQELAQQVIEQCLPFANQSIRIGITGTPGVGKSTFIESFGQYLTRQEKRLAVLAIDPTSQVSRGSILGDKTRMAELSNNEKVFIRPSPAGRSLGGVARKTRETIILCEAAGYDTILVETVGVGQSETAVHSMVDFFFLLFLPGAGDELQGIKRGIMEMGDLVVVNKADGERVQLAKQAKREFRNALHLFPAKESGWQVNVETCSGLNAEGIEKIWEQIIAYEELTKSNQFFYKNRQRQAKYWLEATIQNRLQKLFYENEAVNNELKIIEKRVLKGELSSFQGAELLLKLFRP